VSPRKTSCKIEKTQNLYHHHCLPYLEQMEKDGMDISNEDIMIHRFAAEQAA